MNKHRKIKLSRILQDNTSGSSELVSIINIFFLQNSDNPHLLKNSIRLIRKELNQFAAVKNYVDKTARIISAGNKKKLKQFLSSFEKIETEKIQNIANHFIKKYKYVTKILTISRSGILLKVFELLAKQNEKVKITVLESRPAFEGRLMAESLLKSGTKVEFIIDAMMESYVKNTEAVIIGADKILTNGNVVNKVGSSALALLCRHFKKPFIVMSTKSKYSGEKFFKPKKENAAEVWDFNRKNLTVTNYYFEEIHKKYITEIITE